LGGTIGNFEPERASKFLANVGCHMQEGDRLLLGTDLVKDVKVLNRAYNDAQGVTARFNKNVLSVINQQLKGDFDLGCFEHVAFFDQSKSQIEMYLESTEEQAVRIEGLEMEVRLSSGERILTEISRKFTRQSVTEMLASAGLELETWLESKDSYFALTVARRAG
jgi:L-histidine N-alpha-methyltransferase